MIGKRSIKTPTCRSHLSFWPVVDAYLMFRASVFLMILRNILSYIILYYGFDVQPKLSQRIFFSVVQQICPKMSGIKNGLLIVTCLSKLAASLSVANKKIVNHLYIHYQPSEPLRYEKFSKVSSFITYRLPNNKIIRNIFIFRLFLAFTQAPSRYAGT